VKRTVFLLLLAGGLAFGDDFTVTFGERGLSLDPLHSFFSTESQLYTALYEGLVTYNPVSLAPTPGVAKRWEISDDGKTYRFYLRDEARYSNGDRMRARDFVDSWMRVIDPSADAEFSFLFDPILGAQAYRTGTEKDPSKVGIRAVSDSILEVELEKPAAHFLKALCHAIFIPIHPVYLKNGNWGNAPSLVSNGPFFLSSSTPTEMILERNKLYWDDKHTGVDRVRVVFIDDAKRETEDFLSGGVNWATGGDYGLLKEEDIEKFVVYWPQFATNYFYFNCDLPPWNDYRVRRALSLILPWETIRTKEFHYATDRLVPAIPSYPEVKGISAQDMAAGKKLLAEAGYPDGKGLPPLVVKVSEGSLGASVAARMAAAWKELIGLETVVKEYAYGEYLAEVKKRDFAMGSLSWIGDYADPLAFLQMWTAGSNLNDARFADMDFDRLIDSSMGIEDSKERYEKLAEAEGILLDRAVVLPINNNPSLNLIDLERIEGWFPNPLDIHPFKYIHYKTPAVAPGAVMLPATAMDASVEVAFHAAR